MKARIEALENELAEKDEGGMAENEPEIKQNKEREDHE